MEPMPILECRDPIKLLAYKAMIERAEKYQENARTELANKLGTVLSG
jgi:hypothetical protein